MTIDDPRRRATRGRINDLSRRIASLAAGPERAKLAAERETLRRLLTSPDRREEPPGKL